MWPNNCLFWKDILYDWITLDFIAILTGLGFRHFTKGYSDYIWYMYLVKNRQQTCLYTLSGNLCIFVRRSEWVFICLFYLECVPAYTVWTGVPLFQIAGPWKLTYFLLCDIQYSFRGLSPFRELRGQYFNENSDISTVDFSSLLGFSIQL